MRYDYHCQACQAEVEVSHSMHESPDIECECGAVMQRVLSTPRVSVIDAKHAIVRYTNGQEAKVPMKPHREI